MSSPAAEHVSSSFNPGLVAASYLASYCGCQLTVEILNRRVTALGSLRSWVETISCAISLGLVGTWCMHFIGNRAIVLGNGQPDIQLVYEPGFTVASFILPVVGLTAAFSAAEYQYSQPWIHWVALLGTGIFAGLSIVAMHYVANFGVKNYIMTYDPSFIAASFIVAIGDCLTVLILFYTLREKWISAWWRRMLCAIALAAGISAMHFLAATGCDYRRLALNTDYQIRQRDIQVMIAGVICGAAALLVMVALLIARWRDERTMTRSQKVMLACAIFDTSGRILVTTEGILPTREITDKYNHRTFDEEFDTAHPVFQWVFRVTHNWSSVVGLVSKMRSHLHAHKEDVDIASRPNSSASSAVYDSETYNNFAFMFQERFCTAAASIATSMNIPIDGLGVLYDKVIETGTLNRQDVYSRRNWRGLTREPTPAELEAALRRNIFGRGQLMFITREATDGDATKLLNSGYKFASVQHVGRNIAYALQITLPALERHISGLKRYNENLLITDKPGTWLGFFAMVPKPHHKGFDVVVKKDYREQLPDVQLLPTLPEPWQIAIFDRLNDLRVYDILDRLDDRAGKFWEGYMLHEIQFLAIVRQAVVTLIQPFPQQWIREAKFWSKQLLAHYSHPLQDRASVTTLYAFTVIGDMHASIDGSPALTRTPHTFLEARHRCYAGSPDHAVFARDIDKGFAPVFTRRRSTGRHRMAKVSAALSHTPLHKSMKSQSRGSGHLSSRGSTVVKSDDSSSMHELVDKPHHASASFPSNDKQTPSPVPLRPEIKPHDSSTSVRSNEQPRPSPGPSLPAPRSSPSPARNNLFGGILVTRDTRISARSGNEASIDDVELEVPSRWQVAMSAATPEVTFVDELVAITKQRFLPSSATS